MVWVVSVASTQQSLATMPASWFPAWYAHGGEPNVGVTLGDGYGFDTRGLGEGYFRGGWARQPFDEPRPQIQQGCASVRRAVEPSTPVLSPTVHGHSPGCGCQHFRSNRNQPSSEPATTPSFHLRKTLVGLAVSWLNTSRTGVSRHTGLMCRDIADTGWMVGGVESPACHHCCHR